MKRKNRRPEQIVVLLREAQAKLVEGQTVEEVCRQIGISEATYYNWRKQYGQMDVNQARQFKAVQKENARLKKLVADLSLDNAVLKETLSGNF